MTIILGAILGHNASRHISDESGILRQVGNHLRGMTGSEFRQEAMLLAGDKDLGIRLLQLVLGEAETRGVALAHEIMAVAKKAQQGAPDRELEEVLEELDRDSQGA